MYPEQHVSSLEENHDVVTSGYETDMGKFFHLIRCMMILLCNSPNFTVYHSTTTLGLGSGKLSPSFVHSYLVWRWQCCHTWGVRLGGKGDTSWELLICPINLFQPVLSLTQQHTVHHSAEVGFWDHMASQYCLDDKVFTGAGPQYYQKVSKSMIFKLL